MQLKGLMIPADPLDLQRIISHDFSTDLQLLKTIEEPEKTPEEIISDIGGQLGLWCGMSIMTIIELGLIFYACLIKKICSVGSHVAPST